MARPQESPRGCPDPRTAPLPNTLEPSSLPPVESRLELEVEFKSMEELEKFWSSIPADAHRRWTSRAAEVIVDGSPAWHVLRAVPLGTALRGGPAAGPPAGAEPPLRVPAPGGDRSDDRMAGTLAKLTGDGGPRFQAGGAKSGARGARIVFGDEGGEPEAIDLQFGDPGSPDRFAVTGTTEGGITLVSLGEGGAPGAGPPADPPAPGALGLSDTARPAGVAGAGLGGAPGPAGRAPRAPGGGASLFADVLREAGAADGQLLSPSVEVRGRRDPPARAASQPPPSTPPPATLPYPARAPPSAPRPRRRKKCGGTVGSLSSRSGGSGAAPRARTTACTTGRGTRW